MMQTVKIAKIKKQHIQFTFEEVKEVPFDFVLEIRQGDQSSIVLSQKQDQFIMILELETEDHWDLFLRNELFLSLLALSSGVYIRHKVQYTKKQIDEILRGLQIKLKWQKHFEFLYCELSKIILFKEDLLMFKDLLSKAKLDIMSMAEIKRQIAFRYVKKLGVKMVTESNFRTDIAGTIQRLKDVFKQTSGEDRFKVKGKMKFEEIQKQVRQAYVNSFSNSIDSEVEKQSKQVIVALLQQRFSEIDMKLERRQLNLTKFGVEIEHFINLIIQGEDNKQKVQILIAFLLEKVLKFFRLKPQQICWSGLPTVREVISERSSRSRDYEDYFQEKEELLKTISDLKAQVQKYEKQIQISKVTSKPSTPNIYNVKSLNNSIKFTKSTASKIQKQPRQSKIVKQKESITKNTKLKTGGSSRTSLSSNASLKNINKSSANISSVFDKSKKIAVGLENPLPLLQMKMNKNINTSAVATPKTTSKPKVDSIKKSFEPKPNIRNAKIPTRTLK